MTNVRNGPRVRNGVTCRATRTEAYGLSAAARANSIKRYCCWGVSGMHRRRTQIIPGYSRNRSARGVMRVQSVSL